MTTETKPKTVLKRNRKIKKVQKTQRARITEANIVDILKMYHMENQSCAAIGLKFKTSRQNIAKIIKSHDIPVSAKGVAIYDPEEVLGRAKLDVFSRGKKLSDDALQVCEISLNLIKHELTCLSESLKGGGSLKEQGIDTERFIDKITKFFQAAAPYSIERKDGKTVPDATPENQLHKLMNKKLGDSQPSKPN